MEKSKLKLLLIVITTMFLLAGDITVPIFILAGVLINKFEKNLNISWLKNF